MGISIDDLLVTHSVAFLFECFFVSSKDKTILRGIEEIRERKFDVRITKFHNFPVMCVQDVVENRF